MRSVPFLRSSVVLGACLVLTSFASQVTHARKPQSPAEPWVGEKGITETVAEIMARAQRNGDSEAWDGKLHMIEEFEVERDDLSQDPNSPSVPMWPMPTGDAKKATPVLAQTPGGPNLPQTVGASFLATQLSESGFVPPDTVGAVGPTQVLVCSNGRIKVFDKAGNLGGLNVSTNTFFTSVRNGSTSSDPQVKYDRLSGRWIVVMINTSSPNRVMFAVSSGSTITNSASFTFYFFQQDTVAPAGNTGQLADYPKVGVDANAVVIGCNMFTLPSTYNGTTAWVVRKSSILSGGPIVATAFRGIAPASGNGPYAPSGVDNDDPAATVSYIVGVDNAVFGRLVLRRVSNPGGTPTISGNLNVTVPTTTNPISQAAFGSTNSLDAIDDRLLACQIHRNRVTGVRSLWTAHTNQVNSSGVSSNSGGRNGSRWYQLDNLDTTPTLTQSGTLFDSAASNPRGFWFPSIAMSGQGHCVLGSSYANATVDRAGVATSGRLRTDGLGTVQAATLAVVSSTAYNAQTGGTQRWGDYSAVMIDPTDDQTLWAFAEYCNATNSWGVRAVQLRAPVPATPSSAVPNSLAPGASNVNVVVTGTSSGGSEFYDTEPGVNRIAAAFSGTGITVNSIAWNSPTQITLNVSVSGIAPAGSRNLTVTNPDGQQATGNNLVTVTGGDCNGNGIADSVDIANGTSQDCDGNGVPDECQPDGDGDGTVDACDGCPADPLKTAPGHCGCGLAETPDTDGDGTYDCLDGCPTDPGKIAPGQCGCGTPDTDTDGDGTANCNDGCPNDPGKIAPGICGCGTPDTDSDGDGTPNCHDGCPNDPAKTAPGQCGCGQLETDTDSDGVADCADNCVALPNPGQEDCDNDFEGDVCEIANGAPDCNSNGIVDGCDIGGGSSQDANGDGVPDECQDDMAAFCFPDVSGVRSCPCGNPPVSADRGCDNFTGPTTTSGTGGAKLVASGLPSASPANTLVFQVTEAHNPASNTNLHVFWKGTSTLPAGVKSGFGVRCVAGALKRIYEGTGTGSGSPGSTNSIAFPNATETTDAWTASQMPAPGTTLYYYDSFRDQQGPANCNTANDRFNVSHAVAITWVP